MFKKRRTSSESSKRKNSAVHLEELVLPNSKLRFCADQLQNLNFLFNKKLQECQTNSDKSLILAKSVTERLVQRLLCAVGSLDSRFSSKFLISNNEFTNKDIKLKNLSYYVRLDRLSSPSINREIIPVSTLAVTENDPDYPAAYARIRLHTSDVNLWGDLINPNGYLRRDKIQTKFVKLLADSASRDGPNSPLHNDESISPGIPGKVMDAYTLHHVLKTLGTSEQIFYGPGGNVPRFPDPRDFRLAIIDEPGGIKLKVDFLSPALSNICITVRLLLAIGVDAWPSSTDFPRRISLGHADCLLYHQAAQTGMYLVGYGVQSSAWQMRVPAAELTILNHYSTSSTVKTIRDILCKTIEEVEISRNLRKNKVSYKILNRYILLSVLYEELEEYSSKPSNDLINWSPAYLSCLILKILDRLMYALRHQWQSNYFFKKSNLMINPGHLCEDDYNIEANNVHYYLLRLFDESLTSLTANDEFDRMILTQNSEIGLLYKWKDLTDGLLPPLSTRGRRFSFSGSRTGSVQVSHSEYTIRQMEYISMLLKSMLMVKQATLQINSSSLYDILKEDGAQTPEESFLEDVIYLVITIMDQAKDEYLKSQTTQNVLKNKLKIKSQYNAYTSKLIDLIRKDKEVLSINLHDDIMLVKTILKWLYKALDQNKRYLAPILRPYLNTLFCASHSISWHVDSIKQRQNRGELKALGHFASLVNSGEITPAQGLVDGVNKNWIWAKDMLGMVEKDTLRVLFISDKNQVHRHILSLPSYDNKDECGTNFDEEKKGRTLPSSRNYFSSITKNESLKPLDALLPQHDILRDSSPLTTVINRFHRRGDHRGCGDIFTALVAMQKLNIFREATKSLPSDEKSEVLNIVHNLQSLKNRRAQAKKWSNTISQQQTQKKTHSKDFSKYTPKEESAGVKIKQKNDKEEKLSEKHVINNTLSENCRIVRLKEDSSVVIFQNNLKMKTLLKKSESFKY